MSLDRTAYEPPIRQFQFFFLDLTLSRVFTHPELELASAIKLKDQSEFCLRQGEAKVEKSPERLAAGNSGATSLRKFEEFPFDKYLGVVRFLCVDQFPVFFEKPNQNVAEPDIVQVAESFMLDAFLIDKRPILASIITE